jgi:hypothetical protein
MLLGIGNIWWDLQRSEGQTVFGRLPRVNPFPHPYARAGAAGQAAVCRLLRGSSQRDGVAPKQPRAPRVNPTCQPHARARGPGRGPAATGSLANEIGRAKTAEGSRACFSPAFRAGAWVPKNLARRKRKTRRLLTNRPCSSLVYEESDSKERLSVSNWIVQRLYNYAVKKTVKLCDF